MGKTVSLKKAVEEVRKLHRLGKKVVFTNGCFDIIHAGHVRYLRKARSMGDILIVGLNSDSSIRAIKGRLRPIVPEKERAEVLSALTCVDYVVLFREGTPIRLIAAIKPDVLAKGADWAAGQIAGAGVVREAEGRVARIPLVRGKSTTNIIKRILAIHKIAAERKK